MTMDRLLSLYERMKKLRESGVRMKDISEETDIASSVLSSLYSSVLPMYVNLISNGEDKEKALDKSLQQVNNVSKRKLLGCLDTLYEKVHAIEPRLINGKKNERPFLDDIEKEAINYLPNAGVYTGLYLAYSSSSFSDGLKVEPYMIASITDGDTMPKVYSQNMSGDYYTGIGLFSPFHPDRLFDVQRTETAATGLKSGISATSHHRIPQLSERHLSDARLQQESHRTTGHLHPPK